MDLAPEEIRLLSKINGKTITTLPGYFRSFNIAGIIRKLTDGGYLTLGDTKYTLSKLTIPELKEILKSRKLPLGGKKTELVERILNNVKIADLPPLDKYYVATPEGNSVLKENEALLLFYNSGVYDNVNDVVEMQKQHPEMSGAEIMKALLEKRIEQETDPILLYPLTRKLQNVYHWIGGVEMASKLNGRLSELNELFWKKYHSDRAKMEKTISEKLGMSVEEIRIIREKAEKPPL